MTIPMEVVGPSAALGVYQYNEARHTPLYTFDNNVAHSNMEVSSVGTKHGIIIGTKTSMHSLSKCFFPFICPAHRIVKMRCGSWYIYVRASKSLQCSLSIIYLSMNRRRAKSRNRPSGVPNGKIRDSFSTWLKCYLTWWPKYVTVTLQW